MESTVSLTTPPKQPPAAVPRGGHGIAIMHKIHGLSEKLSKQTHFSQAECSALIHLHRNLEEAGGIVDRMRMREILHVVFSITDEVMLDLVFRTFDKDNDGFVNETEFITGLSTMIRGTTEELSDWCYSVYDINGDGGLAREELSHCLKGCIYPGYGCDPDEVDDCERDIVEIAMKKLDVDQDGQITDFDFKRAVRKDPLLLTSVGPCLPSGRCCAVFLALITENYRNYTGSLGRKKKQDRRASKLGSTSVAALNLPLPKRESSLATRASAISII